jgi:hypothetical protein
MDTVDLNIPTKPIRSFFTFNVMYEDLVFNQGVSQLQTVSANFKTFLVHCPYFEKREVGL